VSFCVCEKGRREDGEWAYDVRSVIVFGRVEIVASLDIIADITTKLCYKFTDDAEYIKDEIKNHADKTLLVKLVPDRICGKRVKEA
jgi:hypothetical protein